MLEPLREQRLGGVVCPMPGSEQRTRCVEVLFGKRTNLEPTHRGDDNVVVA
jgi:hypothetical protein